MLILSLFDVGKAVTDGLRLLGSFLCKAIYWLIANLYELFMNLASVQFLQQNDLKPIYQRVTLILAIIMVFYVTFQTVKYVIEPDSITDKEAGASNVVRRMIIVVVLIALVPQIFSLAYTLQNSLLKNQIFSKIILGKEQVQVDKFGRNFSANVFGMFYFVDADAWDDVGWENVADIKCGKASCQTIVDMNLSTLQSNGTLPYLEVGLTETSKQTDPSGEKQEIYGITFEWLLAVGVGGFICYMLILYCIDVGTRVAQLAFLQIIAPIPIIGYLAPKKDGIFEKWTKQCLATYLDLFLRVSIIYIILFITEILANAYRNKTLINGMTGSTWMQIFMYVALVLGLLTFAKKAPGMLSELFPSMSKASGTLGLGLKDRTEGITGLGKGASKVVKGAAKTVGMGRRVAGAAGGYIAGLASGGGLRGAKEGAKTGFSKDNKGLLRGSAVNRIRQGFNAGARVRQNKADIKNAGGTVFGAEHRQEHFKNIAQEQDRKINNLEGISKGKSTVNSSIGEIKILKQLESMQKAASSAGNTKEALRLEKEIKQVQKAARTYAQSTSNESRAANLEKLRTAVGKAVENTELQNALATDEAKDGVLELDTAKWNTIKIHTNDAVSSVISPEMLELIGDEYITVTVKTKDDDGNDIDKDVRKTIKEVVQNKEDAAKYIGDIADVADSKVAEAKSSPEYLRAHANANGTDNK